MRLFGFLPSRKRRETLQTMEPLLLSLDMTIETTLPVIEDQVKQWDLANRSLMVTLGYMAGYIDSAYQATKPSRYDEQLIEQLFNDRVAKHLSRVQGIEAYMALSKIGGGSNIAGMQGQSGFVEGMMAGGDDFVRFVNDKQAPLSLARLLLGDAG
jgi:hypothetical protein